MPKGMINVYTCEGCKKQMITVDVDEGVTPMLKQCEFCKEDFAMSAFYRCDQNLEAGFEWYKPTDKQKGKLDVDMLEHVNRGGLLFRRRSGYPDRPVRFA